MTLESLVTSINSISLNMSEMNKKLESNEKRAKDLFKVIEFREKLLGGKNPNFSERGFISQTESKEVGFDGRVDTQDAFQSSVQNNSTLYNYTDSVNFSHVNPVTVMSKDIIQGGTLTSGMTHGVTSVSNPFKKGNLAERVEQNLGGTFNSMSKENYSYIQSKRFSSEEAISKMKQQRIADDEKFGVETSNVESKNNERKGTSEDIREEIELNDEDVSEMDEDELMNTIEKPLGGSTKTAELGKFTSRDEEGGLGIEDQVEMPESMTEGSMKFYKIIKILDPNSSDIQIDKIKVTSEEFKRFLKELPEISIQEQNARAVLSVTHVENSGRGKKPELNIQDGALYSNISRENNMVVMEQRDPQDAPGPDFKAKTFKLVRMEVGKDGQRRNSDERDLTWDEYLNFEKDFQPKFRDFLIKRKGLKLFVFDFQEGQKESFDANSEALISLYEQSASYKLAREISDDSDL